MKSRMLLLRVTEGWNETEEPSKTINNLLGRRWTWRCVGSRKKLLTNYSEVNSLIFLTCQWYFQNYSLSASLLPPSFCSLPERLPIPSNLEGQTVPVENHLWTEFCRREVSFHLPFYSLYKPAELIRIWNPLGLWAVFPVRHSYNSPVF